MNTKNIKTFDLQAALKGEPVLLRDGSKAFVRHHETEEAVANNCCIWGLIVRDYAETIMVSWSQQGRFISSKSDNDIIGMYPKTRIINGFEVPAPEAQAPEEGNTYHFPILHTIDLYGTDKWYRDEIWHERYLKRGLVFLTEEDAIANAKAMLGIDPYEEDKSNE